MNRSLKILTITAVSAWPMLALRPAAALPVATRMQARNAITTEVLESAALLGVSVQASQALADDAAVAQIKDAKPVDDEEIAASAKPVSPHTKEKLQKVFEQLKKDNFKSIQWGQLPRKPLRYVIVELFSDPNPEGMKYSALIPVGISNPNVPPGDPNKARFFFLKKTIGTSGEMAYSKPVNIPYPADDPDQPIKDANQ